MGYNRYIYSDATLKAKAANNKAGLLKNKKRSDIVAYGTELVLSQIKYEPKSYLEYGPYWWAMKKVINARGGNLGDTMDEEIATVYKGSSDEETPYRSIHVHGILLRFLIQWMSKFSA